MIRTFDQPCWRIVHAGTLTEYEDGYHEGTAHHGDEADANSGHTAQHAHDNGVAVKAVPFTGPCHVIECNGCGVEPDDYEWSSVHWPTLVEAQKMVPEFDGFVLVDDRDVWCEACKVDPHEHVGNPTAFCDRCGGFDSDHDYALPVLR